MAPGPNMVQAKQGAFDITPGCDLPTWQGNPKLYTGGCPNCGAAAASVKGWGGGEINPDGVIGLRDLQCRWVTTTFPRFTLYAGVSVERCYECWRDLYQVDLGLIANADVSEEWIQDYFLDHEELDKPEDALFTVNAVGLPSRWFLSRLETPEGRLDWHYLGPFVATETVPCLLCGRSIPPDEWCVCSKRPKPVYDGRVYPGPESKLWTDTAALLVQVWPLVVRIAASPGRKPRPPAKINEV